MGRGCFSSTFEANVMFTRNINNLTRSRLSSPYHLQELDTDINNNHARIEDINTILADKSGYAGARDVLEQSFRS